MSTRRDPKDMIFGDILVLEYDKQVNTHARWKCLCMPCNKLMFVTATNLISGNTKSCGCAQKKTNYVQELAIIDAFKNCKNIAQLTRDFNLKRSVINRVINSKDNLIEDATNGEN